MTERNEAHVAIGANWSKDPKDPEAEVARSPKCVREYPGSESDSGSASKMAENLDDERSEKVRQRMAFRRVEDEREKFRQRMALRRAEKRARQLKGRLDDATRKEVESAKWKRRIVGEFFDSCRLVVDGKKATEKDMLKTFASSRFLREMVVLQAEFEISVIERMAERGSIENHFKGLKIASEFAEAGTESDSTPIQKYDDADQASEGSRDEVLVNGDFDVLMRMDIQKVDVDGSSGVECFRVEAFSW